jgi:hypothetical protein
MKSNAEEKQIVLDEKFEEEIDTLLKLYITDPLIIDSDDFLESESFNAGVEKALGIVGLYSCFVSAGISTEDSLELIYNMMGAETSVKIAELQKQAIIEAPAKYEFV